MDDFLPGKNRKTASQIIAEAKASLYPEEAKRGGSRKSSNGGGSQQRVLSTKRPFTPRCAERTRPLSTGLSLQRHHAALMVLEESDDDAASIKLAPLHDSNSRRADLQRSMSANSRFPSLVPPLGGSSSRQQFRPSTAIGVKDPKGQPAIFEDGLDEDPMMRLIHQLQKAQDDASTAQALEQLCQSMRQDLLQHRKDLMTIASRHLSSDNIRILFPLSELLLLLTKDQGSKTLIILASKIIFKLSRDDSNDSFFLSRNTLDLLLTALGHHCPRRDHEAFVYAYGGLKFLSLNGKITAYLSNSLGFLHLCMLHTKLLCEEVAKEKKTTAQVLFQITSCLRNLCNLGENCEKFLGQLEGWKMLHRLVRYFPQDVDVMCNVSRLLSVLTASYEDLFDENCQVEDVVRDLFVILSQHHNRRDVVVRVTFVLGNLAARSNTARTVIGRHSDAITLLPVLLRRYLTDTKQTEKDPASFADEAALDFGSTGNSEDTAVKIIRVFANASIEPYTGSLLAENDTIVNDLLDAVTSANEHLLLPALATLNNLSYYPIANQVEVYNRLRGLLLVSNQSVAAEAARVIGNLSRRKEVRDCLLDDGFLQCTAHLIALEDGGDRDFVSAFVGIVINLMSDERLRPAFKAEEGIPKCIDLLHSCLEDKDWDLACLVCQAIWNYAIDCRKLSDVIDTEHLNELEDVIVYLLEAYNDSTMHEEGDEDDEYAAAAGAAGELEACRFCQVALTLLKRILDDSPRKVELLLND